MSIVVENGVEACEYIEQLLSKPSLPSNLDEASEEIVREWLAYGDGEFDKLVKAGAEWMAGQGITKEAVIGMATKEIFIKVSEQTLDELDLRAGDKVVLQIRKKQ